MTNSVPNLLSLGFILVAGLLLCINHGAVLLALPAMVEEGDDDEPPHFPQVDNLNVEEAADQNTQAVITQEPQATLPQPTKKPCFRSTQSRTNPPPSMPLPKLMMDWENHHFWEVMPDFCRSNYKTVKETTALASSFNEHASALSGAFRSAKNGESCPSSFNMEAKGEFRYFGYILFDFHKKQQAQSLAEIASATRTVAALPKYSASSRRPAQPNVHSTKQLNKNEPLDGNCIVVNPTKTKATVSVPVCVM